MWHQLAEKFRNNKIEFILEPTVRFRGEPGEQATMFLNDPSGNTLEFKTMKNTKDLFSG
jgi:extradiol dioxygenase family protein